jgi:hypothetical protein
MNDRLLASGRVAYHPMCNWLGDGEFDSILSAERTRVTVRRKVVDASYLSPSVPSTHVPRFAVEPGVRLVPPNALPELWSGGAQGRVPGKVVIVGAGKTAMDAIVWLIHAGTSPEAIQWVMPRDSWLINRITTQPGPEFFKEAIGGQADQMEAFAEASSTEDLFLRLEACGNLLRIDRDRMPTMFHLATISRGEVDLLRGIRHVIRLGRVQRLSADHMQLDEGRVAVEPDTLFVDCTASAVEPRPLQPIFQGDRIVLPACAGRLSAGDGREHAQPVPLGPGQGPAAMGAGQPAGWFRQADVGRRPSGRRKAGHPGALQAAGHGGHGAAVPACRIGAAGLRRWKMPGRNRRVPAMQAA